LVIIVAGEASADLHGANLVKAMSRMKPGITFRGIGGKLMEQAGVELLVSASDMAVVGLTEVFYRLRAILKATAGLKSVLKYERPDLLILLDYPDFNLHIAGYAKRYGIPVLYYISPQIWAWRKGRIKKIVRRVDRMAVIFPFEAEYYRHRGVHVDYVGHPLLDSLPSAENEDQVKGLNHRERSSSPVLGLLPGSRKEEIRKLLPVMVKSAEILEHSYPGMRCLLPLAPTLEQEFVRSFIRRGRIRIEILQEPLTRVLSVCDAALVTSGTATLETAIVGTPMVIVYRVSRFSYWLGKQVVKVPYIGLVNLVAEEAIVPELIQDEVSPERLADEAKRLLGDEAFRNTMIRRLAEVSDKLGQGGASRRCAGIALEMLEHG